MPPRSGQLDEISQAIGGLQASVENIERYMHEREHGLNNLSQKIDALRVGVGKDIAAVEAKLDARLSLLERARERDAGARTLATTFLQSPVIAWLFAIAVAAWTYFKGPAR